jgi:hypothetical protein
MLNNKKIKSLPPLQEFQVFIPIVERDERVYHRWRVMSCVSPSISNLSVVARRKKGGLLYFEANPHHSFATKVT